MRRFLVFLGLLFLPSPARAQTEHLSSLRFESKIEGIQEFIPPAIYDRWWRDAARCAGIRPLPDRTGKVHFFYVMSDMFFVDDVAVPFWGLTFAWRNQIFVVFHKMLDRKVVTHEMLHFMLYQKGIWGGHPDAYFKRCHLDA